MNHQSRLGAGGIDIPFRSSKGEGDVVSLLFYFVVIYSTFRVLGTGVGPR